MASATSVTFHIHFETRRTRAVVFRMTTELIDAAKSRSGMSDIHTTLGSDLADLTPLATANALVTSNDVLRDPKFPLRDLLRQAPNLQWIHINGAGIEPLLPLDWLPDRIRLTNNSGVHVEKLREFALMALLMMHARLPAMMTNQRESRWEQIFTPRIKGRTVLVIGVGHMGGTVAEAAKSLGCRVLGIRMRGAPHPHVDRMFREDELDQVLPQADMVVLSVPVTPRTKLLMNRERFALMKPGAAFMNIGRAASIDHEVLAEVLKSGTLSGAVIDVHEREPLPSTSPLWRTPNLVITPHVSSDDAENYMPKTMDIVFENARRLRSGEALKNVVDPVRGY